MNILLTGFDPFGEDEINPASLILNNIPEQVGNHRVHTLQVPTAAKRCRVVLEEALAGDVYDAVICLGQAGGRPDITLERVAINLDEFRIADNDGEVLSGQKIVEDGPDGYLSTLPLKAMVDNIQKHNIPASISYTAGTFVCNHIYYLAHFFMEKQGNARQALFIHVPYLPEQTALRPQYPSMALDLMSEAIIAAIEAIDAEDLSDRSFGNIC